MIWVTLSMVTLSDSNFERNLLRFLIYYRSYIFEKKEKTERQQPEVFYEKRALKTH